LLGVSKDKFIAYSI